MKALQVAVATFFLLSLVSADYIGWVQEFPCQPECRMEKAECTKCDKVPRPECTSDLNEFYPLKKCYYYQGEVFYEDINATHSIEYKYSSMDECNEKKANEDNIELELRLGYCYNEDGTYYKIQYYKELPKAQQGSTISVFYEPGSDCTGDIQYQIYTKYYSNFMVVNCTDTESIWSKDDLKDPQSKKKSLCYDENTKYDCVNTSNGIRMTISVALIVILSIIF